MSDLQQSALAELHGLVEEITALVDQRVETMDPDTLAYIMNHYRKYLKVNLEESFDQAHRAKQHQVLEKLFHTP